MGPRLISRGDVLARENGSVVSCASMGPRLISRGDTGGWNWMADDV